MAPPGDELMPNSPSMSVVLYPHLITLSTASADVEKSKRERNMSKFFLIVKVLLVITNKGNVFLCQ